MKALNYISMGIGRYSSIVLLLFLFATLFFQRLQPPLIALMLIGLFFERDDWSSIRSRLEWKNVSLWFALYFLLHVVGVFYSSDKDFGWQDVGMKASFIVFPIYFLFIKGMDKSKVMNAYTLIGSISAIACISIALYQSIAFDHNVLKSEKEFSIFMHRSYQAMYWCLGALWSFYQFLNKAKFRWGFLMTCMILIMGTMLTFSKAGIIALILGLVLIMVITVIGQKRYRLAISTLAAGILIAFVVNYITPKPLARFQAMIASVFESSQGELNESDSNTSRILMWQTSMDVIAEHPIAGVGSGDIKAALRAKNEEKGYNELVKKDLNSHNQFLNSGVALGLIGMSCLILIFLSAMFFGTQQSFPTWLGGLLAGMILLFMLTESGFETQAGIVTFTFVLCLLGWRSSELKESSGED